ncbi:hypothetical protein MNBD_CPR01-441 [hydrothermal vent metagenome]|uniref:30S ribosomal protein S21 n=1 Tax=hydrothermal vent metagenome TaxID=652676 RepID=A0A3B0UTE5_9ZZZZ
MTGTTQVEVRRGKNENTVSLIRRFSRRAKGTNIVRLMRVRRYYIRLKSKNVDRNRALIGLARREKYREMVKLGKIDPTKRRTRRR